MGGVASRDTVSNRGGDPSSPSKGRCTQLALVSLALIVVASAIGTSPSGADPPFASGGEMLGVLVVRSAVVARNEDGGQSAVNRVVDTCCALCCACWVVYDGVERRAIWNRVLARARSSNACCCRPT